jgi:hypothetical protein
MLWVEVIVTLTSIRVKKTADKVTVTIKMSLESFLGYSIMLPVSGESRGRVIPKSED